jgi:Uncharacterized conserved protein (DUF2075)
MLTVLWTPRFEGRIRRFTGLQDLTAKKTLELLRKYVSSPNTWHFELEKMKDNSFGEHHVFKIALTAGDRLIFIAQNNKLILCDVGKHEVMQEYASLNKAFRDSDIRKALKPPEWFSKYLTTQLEHSREGNVEIISPNHEKLFESIEGEERWFFEEELSGAWLTYLDDEQTLISETLYGITMNSTQEMQVFFILGGPGTGKTIILLNMAINLSKSGRSVSFELAPQVLKYLNSGNQVVPGANFGVGPGVTLLIDDPGAPEELAMKLRHARTAKCSFVIVALDPLQWHKSKAAYKFDQIYAEYNVKVFTLWNCYRQSRNVGEKALGIIKRLFTIDDGAHIGIKKTLEIEETRKYLELSLGMEFKDNMGRFLVYFEKDLINDIESECLRFQNRYEKWKHFHPLCIVYHEDTPAEIRNLIQKSTHGTNKKDIAFKNYQDIRGVEFQELFLVLPLKFWNDLSGALTNSNLNSKETYSSLHTILSRPKDSLVVFLF